MILLIVLRYIYTLRNIPLLLTPNITIVLSQDNKNANIGQPIQNQSGGNIIIYYDRTNNNQATQSKDKH